MLPLLKSLMSLQSSGLSTTWGSFTEVRVVGVFFLMSSLFRSALFPIPPSLTLKSSCDPLTVGVIYLETKKGSVHSCFSHWRNAPSCVWHQPIKRSDRCWQMSNSLTKVHQWSMQTFPYILPGPHAESENLKSCRPTHEQGKQSSLILPCCL